MRSVKIITASFAQTKTILSAVFKKLWFVLALPVASSYFMTIAGANGFNQGGGGQISFSLSIILNLFFWFMMVPVSICWTEKVITRSAFALNFDFRILSSIGYTLLVYLIIFVPIWILFFVFIALGREAGMNQYLAGTLFVVSAVIWWANSARFVLIQPAIAVRNVGTRLKRSWQITKGNVLKILLATLIPILSLSMLVGFAGTMVQVFQFDQISVVASSVFLGALQLYFVMILSEVYARIFIHFLAPQKLGDYL